MHLENFTLRYETQSVELEAFGRNWDLHNWAELRGIRYEPITGDVFMEWTMPATAPEHSWGDFDNHASLCRLRFSGVSLLRMGPRDPAYPSTESDRVASVEIVADADPERMVFEMQDERLIEIAAATVRLEYES